MECHDYTNPSRADNESIQPEFVYKLSPRETHDFVKLRISNKNLFNGKRNASMCGWRAILRHMGLQDKMTHYQAAKKWENLKKKYKEVKYPPKGVSVFRHWPYFTLMNDAMEGRLDGSASVLTTSQEDKDDVLNFPRPKRKKVSSEASPELFAGPEIEVTLNGEVPGEGHVDIGHILQEVDDEKHVMDKHKQVMEREHLLLQRERAALDREIAALERDRASLDRDRAAIEREKALLDRERAIVDKERESVCKDRQALEQEKARLVRTEGDEENTFSDMDRKERFLFLFEKLINNF